MTHLHLLLSLLALIHASWAKAVFAHFMLANAQNYTTETWADDIELAKQAHIEAFALNLAYNPDSNLTSVMNDAFQTAAESNFSLFFSFDYGPSPKWPKTNIIDLLQRYASSSAYTRYGDRLLISTFEGADNADDWVEIKQTDPCAGERCFFIPAWSSIGAEAALKRGNGVADGLFNWNAWPDAPNTMTTSLDKNYVATLAGKPYMMAVSPCFYTNLPNYGKNWLWQGDHLWIDRWDQVLAIQPEFVEILTWNDYGESHYIGPLRNDALAVLDYGGAPFNYSESMTHDGWRATLPFSADLYLLNRSSVASDILSVWFRPNPASTSNCSDGATTANTASQGQTPLTPKDVLQDRIFFSVLSATMPKSLMVTIGGTIVKSDWINRENTADGGRLWHGNTSLISGQTGEVVVSVVTDSSTMQVVSTQGIASCLDGWTNFNYWTGFDLASSVAHSNSSLFRSTPMPSRLDSSSATVSKLRYTMSIGTANDPTRRAANFRP